MRNSIFILILTTFISCGESQMSPAATAELFPSHKFFNLVDNQFSIQNKKRRLTDAEYENRKETFLKSADSKIIL